MALAPVVLDDLTWSDFSTAAIQRIPAASAGLWTLNAPVDPGITLLDLFGWLLEQRLYWMDQVSNPLNRALFALLGITPNQAVAATTVLYIEPNGASGETSGAVLLPLGTQVQLANGQSPPVFTTLEAVTIFPLADAGPSARFQAPLVTLMVGTNDRSVNLAQGRSPALLDPDGGDTQIVLSFSSAASGSAGGTLALFFELLTPPGLATGWSPNAPTGPPGPNALTWLVTVNGTLTPLDSGQVVDGTLSLRRSGVVVLTIPSGWTVEPNTTADFAVVLRAQQAVNTFPPRISRLIPNVVTAVNSRPTSQLTPEYIQGQVETWRRLPGNVFVLPEGDRPALAPTVKVEITEMSATTPTTWQQVDDLTTAGPDDRMYVLDATAARLRFGDGVTGQLPVPKDTKSVTVSYSVGGGIAGNLGSLLPWVVPGQPALSAWNIVEAAGGADAETIAAVRERAPAVVTYTGRAITQADFEQVATVVPGTAIARADAAIGRHPLFPNRVVPGAVTVFLVPDVPRNSDGSPDYGSDEQFPAGPVADAPTIAAVLAALNQARLVTSEVFVETVNYRPLTINLTVTAQTSDPQALRNSLYQALQQYFDPLVGGDEGSGWPFGGPVRPSTLLKIAQNAIGSAGTISSVSIALDDPSVPAQGCTDVQIGADNLVVLTDVVVSIVSPPAGQGGLP